MVVLGLAACSTDDAGNGTMTATINGVTWRAEKVTGTRTGTTISVSGQSTPYPIVTLDGSGVVGPGTYRVTDNIFDPGAADFSVLDRTGFAVTGLGGGTGALVITSWTDSQAAGTFNFNAGQGSAPHNVSGQFTVKF